MSTLFEDGFGSESDRKGKSSASKNQYFAGYYGRPLSKLRDSGRTVLFTTGKIGERAGAYPL